MHKNDFIKGMNEAIKLICTNRQHHSCVAVMDAFGDAALGSEYNGSEDDYKFADTSYARTMAPKLNDISDYWLQEEFTGLNSSELIPIRLTPLILFKENMLSNKFYKELYY